MIELDRPTITSNYTLLFNGNSGENQMIITYCCEQSGRIGVRITTVSVDDARIASKWIVYRDEKKLIEQTLETVKAWIVEGLPGDTAPSIKKATRAINTFFRYLK